MKCIIFGTGSIGKRHIKNLIKILGGSIDIIAYKTTKEDIEILEELGVRPFYNIKDAFAEKPDFAIIANPTSMHVEYSMKAAEHGCDLFIEKPVSDSMKGIEKLRQVVKKKNLITFVPYVLRFSKPLMEIKKVIDSRRMGKVLSAEVHVGSNLAERHKDWDYRTSYAANKSLGGGVSLDMSHEVDYARWLFGELEIEDAFVGKKSDLDMDADDTCDIKAKTKDGAKINIHMDYIESPPRRYCRIECEKGPIIWDRDSSKVKAGKETIDVSEDYNEMFMREMEHFLGCVKNRKETLIPLEDGIRTLQLVLKAREISGWK